MNIKQAWKKFWNLLWHDQSLKGWIFSFIFLFIFIKLIFFPTLNFVTGTTWPLAIVESCSMYHEPVIPLIYSFNDWWENHEEKYETYGITKEQFKSFLLHNGFSKGDILFAIKATPSKLKVGDVIMFDAGQPNPIIHRIIKIEKNEEEYVFSTIGDNNWQSLTTLNNIYSINEIGIKENQLVGKALFKITPYIGWTKLIFFEPQRSLSERGFCQEN